MTHIDVVTQEDLWKENIDGYFPFLLDIYNPDIKWSQEEKNAYGQKNCHLRLICDECRVVYNQETYLPCAFNLAMPETDGQKIGNATLSISALDYRIRLMLSSIRIPCEVTVVAMFAKTKKVKVVDGEEVHDENGAFIFSYKKMESFTFKMETAEANKTTAKFVLMPRNSLQGDIPYDIATPERVPATSGR